MTSSKTKIAYSDWITRGQSKTVWLEEGMTAISQLAYLSPIERKRHWIPNKGRKVDCLEAKPAGCPYCRGGLSPQHDYTYGIFVGANPDESGYLILNRTSHLALQELLEEIKQMGDPLEVVFAVSRGKFFKTKHGRTMGYKFKMLKRKPLVDDSDIAPNIETPTKTHEWIIPTDVAEYLVKYDDTEVNMIDLYTELKERFPSSPDTDLRTWIVQIVSDRKVNLENVRKQINQEV